MDKDRSEKQTKITRTSDRAAARDERLKEALRANLKRRKSQVRARRDTQQPDKD